MTEVEKLAPLRKDSERAPPEHDPGVSWTFAGWGQAERILDLEEAPLPSHREGHQHEKLGEWSATAICGNDITSSVLYVAALTTLAAGVYAPLALLCVGIVLYLFRAIYAEVGSALPLNGGAYNVLLNTTSKAKASVAACLTLLSYIATAVISSNEALHYLHHVLHSTPILVGTIILLGIFAVLSIVGITESAIVALVIFVLHLATLVFLAILSGIHVYGTGFSVLAENWAHPPEVSLGQALFFGFAAGMLGVSGFESSANFIEEQKPGVFEKTLRNMWVAVFIFNPLFALLALGVVPLGEYGQYKEALLSEMGHRAGRTLLGEGFGSILSTWVSIDAVLVLSGAVLTSYVGVTGLVRRMALDRIMPQTLLRENKWRGTPHWIVVGFFLLCVSILMMTQGEVATLAGVYTISFLGVMLLFAIGNRLLAVKRGRLPRTTRATWVAVAVAFCAVATGLVGKIIENLNQSIIFLIYFAVAMSVVVVMFNRVRLFQVLLYIGASLHDAVRRINERIDRFTTRKINEINSQAIVFFTRGDGPANLRRAIEYVLQNEQTQNLKVVHVYEDEHRIPPKLAAQLRTLDEIFPEIRIDFIAVQGRFSPDLVLRLSHRLNVPRNYMFIGCPGDRFPHNLADLGGVRLIV